MRSIQVACQLFLICSLQAFAAQEKQVSSKRTFRVESVQEEIKVNGVLDESVWQRTPTFTLDYETSPGDNTPPPVRTEMWVASAHSHLYIAARANDPNPENIRARLTDRDHAFQDDHVGVVLDTFNDKRRGFAFFVNPLGVQMDLLRSDVTGNEDVSWDAIWNSAGHLTPQGYEVEMEIPFSSLRFPFTGSSQTWGIAALRIYPRDQRYRIALNALPRGGTCLLCNGSKLEGMDGVKPGRNIEFDPTFTGQRAEERDDPNHSFDQDTTADAGLTARWGITPSITWNGAANPDFSQVEADTAQLTVNKAFAIFYPEKRPLFLEGADLFDTKIQGFYSRDIADPKWAVKLTGKAGKNAFGAIVGRDELTNFIFPGNQSSSLGSLNQENTSAVLRYRLDLGYSSTFGGLVTSREGPDYYNRVIGADTFIRHGAEAFRLEVLGSKTDYPLSVQHEFDQTEGDLDGVAIRAAYNHSVPAWVGYLQYTGANNDFRADLGFIPQVGYHKGLGLYERRWYSDNNEHWWRKISAGAETTWLYDREGSPLQQQVAPYLDVNGPQEWFSHSYFAFGPGYYLGRRFDRNFVDQYIEMRPTGWFYWNFEGRIGQEIDYDNIRQGKILRLIPGVRFDLARHFRLEVNHNFERLHVDGGRLYRASATDVRATYQINTRTFVRAITQYFDVSRNPKLYIFDVLPEDDALFSQFLFSYKINPQVILFFGYSDNYSNTTLSNLSQTSRTLFLKVGYAFVL